MLLWLDTETTGLDPQEDLILEVAWHLTDGNLNDLGGKAGGLAGETREAVVSHGYASREYAWRRMDDYVRNMHQTTGLWRDLQGIFVREPLLVLSDIEEQILTDLDEYTENGRPVFLAGASVHFDKGFIESYMPRLFGKISHRVYDTSTLKAFFGSLGVDHNVINEGQHRAANDVDETLAVARYYRDWTQELQKQLFALDR